jgi:hypothetical protein
MDPDPLQWLWDGVSDFQTKFMQNEYARMPCSCCNGALSFDEACHVKDKLTCQRPVPNEKERTFKGVPASVCWGIENCKELFGLGSDKEALSVVALSATTVTVTVTVTLDQLRDCQYRASEVEPWLRRT